MITTTYRSPLGDVSLSADGRGLTELRFAADEHIGGALGVPAACFDMYRGAYQHPVSGATLEEIEGCDAVSGARSLNAGDPRNCAAVGVLERTWAWLNAYFAGQDPQWVPPVHGAVDEAGHAVWVALLETRFGDTVSRASLLEHVHRRSLPASMAIDGSGLSGALRACPISIVIPVHRVVDLDWRDESAARIAAALRTFEADHGRTRRA